MTGRDCVAERVARLRILLAQEEEGVVIDEQSLESALRFLDELATGGPHARPSTFVRQDGVVRLLWAATTGERPWYQYGVSFVPDAPCQVVWSDERIDGGLDHGLVERDDLQDHVRTVRLEGFVRRDERKYDLD